MVRDVGNINAIKTTITYKEKWFDNDCEVARKKAFRFLNLLRRSPNSELYKTLYNGQLKSYREVCLRKKEEYFKIISQQLKNINSSKQWWEWVNNFKNKCNNSTGNLNACEFGMYFNNLLNESALNVFVSHAFMECKDELLDMPFTIAELEESLCAMKDKKAPGIDRLPLEFFKYGSTQLKQLVVRTLNRLLDGEYIV